MLRLLTIVSVLFIFYCSASPDFSFAVKIVYTDRKQAHCLGSLITESKVLTACECVGRLNTRYALRLLDPDDIKVIFKQQAVKAKEVVACPCCGFTATHGEYKASIGMIKLSSDLKLENVKLIALESFVELSFDSWESIVRNKTPCYYLSYDNVINTGDPKETYICNNLYCDAVKNGQYAYLYDYCKQDFGHSNFRCTSPPPNTKIEVLGSPLVCKNLLIGIVLSIHSNITVFSFLGLQEDFLIEMIPAALKLKQSKNPNMIGTASLTTGFFNLITAVILALMLALLKE